MKNIPLNNALCIYDEGELVAVYEVKPTKADVVKALADYNYFNDEDLEIGIDDCYSLKDVAGRIIEDGKFFDEAGDHFFGLNGNSPSSL